MKYVVCPKCDSNRKPPAFLIPFKLAPESFNCSCGHVFPTDFELRSEITGKKLLTVSMLVVGVAALIKLTPSTGFGLAVVAAVFGGLIGGGLIGALLYQFAAVPLQVLIEGGKAVGNAVKPAGEAGKTQPTAEERRLAEFMKKPSSNDKV